MNPYEFFPWFPDGVEAGNIIAAGGNNFIAFFNDKATVLKYPLVPAVDTGNYTVEGRAYRQQFRNISLQGLEVEAQLLETLGQHPRIINYKGKNEDGILLEYVPHGSIENFLRKNPSTSREQRLKWAVQAAEGLAFIHGRHILHCDINIGNLLLDQELNIKYCDFQGRLMDSDGNILLNGGALENATSSMPRSDPMFCDRKTDIFALGTILYFLSTGQLPFFDLLLDFEDHEDEIRRRFMEKEFQFLDGCYLGQVVEHCWNGSYESASDLWIDLKNLHA